MKTQPTKQHKQAGPLHYTITWVASILVLAGLSAVIWFWVFYERHEETNDAQVEQYITPVQSRITGYIAEVRYQDNDPVRKGDTLVVIDNREWVSKWQQAQAELAQAREGIDVLEQGVAATRSNTGIQQAQLDAAKAQLWKAEQDYHRFENLLKEEAATGQQFEAAKASYDQARARYTEVERSMHHTEIRTGEAASRVPVAADLVKARQAALDNAALYLSYTIITAPYDGWVGKRTVQPGQLVKEGQTLVQVVSREKWITANFKETQVAHLHEGQAVEVRVDAFGGKDFHGLVQSLSPASGARFALLPPDNATGNFVKIEQRIPVRIALTDPGAETVWLRAGMNVVVTAAHNR